MFKFILPIILIGASVTGFFLFVNPNYKEMILLKDQMTSYDQALTNSKSLESERDKLTKKKSSIDLDNLNKLNKLLPDNVDNIRLILEIEKIASPYGMVLKDVKYDVDSNEADKSKTDINKNALLGGEGASKLNNHDYGIWDLEFSVEGSYNNFLLFTKDLEKNLRIVDIASIQFSSEGKDDALKLDTLSSYKYSFKIKTYWMKN